jgi:hypothetical protein
MMSTKNENKLTELSPVDVMKRASFVRLNCKTILKFDLSGLCRPEDVSRVVDYFRFLVRRLNRESMVGLIDFSDLSFSDEVIENLILLTVLSNPFFRASAVISNNQHGDNIVKALFAHFPKLNFHVLKDETAARECLEAL